MAAITTDQAVFPRLFAGIFRVYAKAYCPLFSLLRYRWRPEFLQCFSIHIGLLVTYNPCEVAHQTAGCSQIAGKKSEKFTIRKVIHKLQEVINNRNDLLTKLFPSSRLHSFPGKKE
jgi:hypothetical protein